MGSHGSGTPTFILIDPHDLGKAGLEMSGADLHRASGLGDLQFQAATQLQCLYGRVHVYSKLLAAEAAGGLQVVWAYR